jgi:alkaline phosphatase
MLNNDFLTRLSILLMVIPLSCSTIKKEIPQNIIVLIADGGGFNHIDAASLFQYGQTGQQVYEKFPVRLAVSTYSDDGNKYDPVKAWKSFDWVRLKPTDSAAAATAISTGFKTHNGYLGVDTLGRVLETILERAEKLDKSSGVVTSVTYNHATPAGFCVHDTSRDNYVAITDYMLNVSGVDVIMGAGNPLYDDNGQRRSDTISTYAQKKLQWQKYSEGITGADADGDGDADMWEFVEAKSDFVKLAAGSTPLRVLGLAKIQSTLQQARSGSNYEKPYQDIPIQTVPSLQEITKAALNILDEDADGFFLMIEGGAVDWASHDHQTGRMIEELIDFNLAAQCVVDWVYTHSSWDQTLLIVTADHETGYLTGPGSGENDTTFSRTAENWKPMVNNGQGNLPGLEWHSYNHTNSLVPFYARGAGADKFLIYADEKDPVRGKYIDNTEIGKVMFELWNDKGHLAP